MLAQILLVRVTANLGRKNELPSHCPKLHCMSMKSLHSFGEFFRKYKKLMQIMWVVYDGDDDIKSYMQMCNCV